MESANNNRSSAPERDRRSPERTQDEERIRAAERTARRARNVSFLALGLSFLAAGLAVLAWRKSQRRESALGHPPRPVRSPFRAIAETFAASDDLTRYPASTLTKIASAASVFAAIACVGIWLRVPHSERSVLVVLALFAMVAAGVAVGGWLAVAARRAGAQNDAGVPSELQRHRTRTASRIGATIYVGASVLALLWFRCADVWNTQFGEPGLIYLGYNATRLVFATFLAVGLIGAGQIVIRYARAGTAEESRPALESVLLSFYVGAATWIIGLFGLALVGALYWWLLLLLASAAAWAGFPLVARLVPTGRRAFGQSALLRSAAGAISIGVLAITLAAIWGLVLLNSGLAVSGFEYDSSGHYLPYYQAVIENHGVQPNELWYHFWVSKGAGLHFLAVMLTDLQGPQFVSFVFILLAAGTMFALVREASGSAAWGLAATAVLSAAFIGHFPFYQKHHLVTLGLVAGLLWTTRRKNQAQQPRARAASIAMLAVALVINAPPIAAVVLPFVGVLGMIDWKQSRSERSIVFRAFAPVTAAFIALVFVVGLNFLWTGLGEVTPFKLFFDQADQERLSRHVSPYLILLAQEGSSGSTGTLSLAAVASANLLASRIHALLQLNGFAPHLLFVARVAAVVLLVAAIAWRSWRHRLSSDFIPVLVLISVSIVVGFFVNQPGSLERFYAFAFFPVVYFVFGATASFFALLGTKLSQPLNQLSGTVCWCIAALLGAASGSYWATAWINLHGRDLVLERAAFAVGARSFEQALTHVHYRRDEKGWPRRDLSEGCLGIRDALVKRAVAPIDPPRVWTISFLQESGCHVMPGARIQMEFSVAFGNRWHAIVFGAPDTALKELRRIGVNYFYVNLADFNMQDLSAISTSVFGCLAYSPLFAPEGLRESVRVVWRKGQAYLLTFDTSVPGEPLGAEFVDAWRRKVFAPQHGLGDMPGLCARLAHYYDSQQERWPIRAEESLPRLKGWQ